MNEEIIEITDWLAKQEQTAGQTKFEGKVIEETEKAIQLKFNGGKWWIPKSQIESRKAKPPEAKKIGEIDSDDIEIRIFAKVVSVGDGKFDVDGGSGKLTVFCDGEVPDWIEEGGWVNSDDMIEVWGTPLKVGDSLEIHPDRIKPWSKI